jgi:hypothetical protein
MKQKKIYLCPEVQVANIGVLDVLSISGDPSIEDLEWVS